MRGPPARGDAALRIARPRAAFLGFDCGVKERIFKFCQGLRRILRRDVGAVGRAPDDRLSVVWSESRRIEREVLTVRLAPGNGQGKPGAGLALPGMVGANITRLPVVGATRTTKRHGSRKSAMRMEIWRYDEIALCAFPSAGR